MTKMHDNNIPFGKSVKEIILETVSKYNFPVVFDFPAGHLDDNRTLVLGETILLDVNEEKTSLSFISN